MKKVLKGKHFAEVEEEKQKMAEALKGTKIDEFNNCFDQWEKCLDRCIVSIGGMKFSLTEVKKIVEGEIF